MLLPPEGLRVLGLTIWRQKPMTSVVLTDMGAGVVKAEGQDSHLW
jgi:crotonobetainyl-CoA:carnitine CoA-transferase CaiB-like acyl-CoA transferase